VLGRYDGLLGGRRHGFDQTEGVCVTDYAAK
jgi:hypothetical protein